MEIIVAESAGFCFGVKRAVNKAYAAAENGDKVYTYGELIHNPVVGKQLEEKGISVVENFDSIQEGTLIIRSHGAQKSIFDELSEKNIKIIDATCPYVKSIQNKVENFHQKGYTVIIVGDSTHPEVIGINGWCCNEAIIINSIEEARYLRCTEPVAVVAQTTILKSLYEAVCSEIQKKYPNADISDTICTSTKIRQDATRQIAKSVDAMIVIGGMHSSNTNKLAEISRRYCKKVVRIEDAKTLVSEEISGCKKVGVTAGASTPAKEVTEVIHKLENTSEAMEQALGDIKRIKTGDIITGEIIAVNQNEVYLNIGYKSDGIIKKSDFLIDLYDELTSIAAVGDKVEAMVIDMNDGSGNVALSKNKVDEISAYNDVEAKFNSKEVVSGKITKIVKGGVLVDIGYAKAFMPANQYALRYTEDLNALLGKQVEGRIIEFDREKNKIIFSRKVILAEERDKKRAEELKIKTEAIEKLEVGSVVEAPVKNLTDFGVFVDLSGIDGFIHVSDLSWKRVSRPSNFCSVGDVLTAKVVEIDKENFKVKLTVKGMTEEPWTMFKNGYKTGDVVECEIKNIAKFGAFAEIIPGVEGLIHISNLAHDKVESVESCVSVGQKVKCKIISVEDDKRKIGLSIKDTVEPPKKKIEADKVFYKEDSKVTLEEAFKKYLG